MILSRLHLYQFRNIQALDWQPHARANLILGSNAQGKTNLLESIFLLGTTKSLRHGTDSDDLIREGKQEALVSGSIQRESPEVTRELEVQLRRGESRQVRLNGKKLAPLSKVFGQFTVVLFVPEDLSLVKAGPNARRYYLDLEISQASPQYLAALQYYQRALKQRNGALRLLAEGKGNWEAVEAFDEALIQSGSEIVQFRAEAIKEIEPLARDVQARVAGKEEEALSLRYISSVEDPLEKGLPVDIEGLKHRFSRRLKARAGEERARVTTLTGPHRDDLEVLIAGKSARLFASQGQQRTTALALKLAEVQFLAKRLGETPVLLLDDVLSELDLKRQERLLGLLDEKVQTFVTSTHAEGMAYKPGRTLAIQDGGLLA